MAGSHNTHARLAPSGSKCWTTCTSSVALAEANPDKVPEDTSSPAAEEGTLAHDWAEFVLRGTKTLEDLKADEGAPEDMHDAVKVYTDHCQSLTGGTPFVETQVPLFYDKDSTGTVDFAMVGDNRINIVDYKHGAGVFVEVLENPQLAIYALSMIDMLEDDGIQEFYENAEVVIQIVQPRHHAGDPIRTWTLTLNELRDFCRDIEYAAIQIREGKGLKFAPGEDACRWCKCKGFCEPRAESLAAPAGGVPSLVGFCNLDESLDGADHPRNVLTDEQLVSLFENGPQIKKMLDDIAGYLMERLDKGETIDGVKLVMGREGNRKWLDEAAADKVIGRKLKADIRYHKKLISPTAAQKLLSEELKSTRFANRFEAQIGRAPAKPVIAPASDKRTAVGGKTDGFEDLT